MDNDSMETSILSYTTQQRSIYSAERSSVVSQPSSVNQQVLYQISQMKAILTSFFWHSQETTRTASCNYLASEVESGGKTLLNFQRHFQRDRKYQSAPGTRLTKLSPENNQYSQGGLRYCSSLVCGLLLIGLWFVLVASSLAVETNTPTLSQTRVLIQTSLDALHPVREM